LFLERDKLGLRAAAVQIPIGLEAKHSGVVDIIDRKALYFLGSHGQRVSEEEVPDNLVAEMEDKRQELLEQLAEVDEILMEKLLTETPPTPEEIRAAIRRATIQLKFVPVFMGAAFKNKGVQPLLDGVCSYLPDPTEVYSSFTS
jgi:elongation factor G